MKNNIKMTVGITYKWEDSACAHANPQTLWIEPSHALHAGPFLLRNIMEMGVVGST